MTRHVTRLVALALIVVLAACGGQAIQGVASVEIVGGDRDINLGSDVVLTAQVTASSGVDTTVTWSSSAGAVATVNASGVITPLTLGSTTITATSTADTSKSASAVVTVTVPNLADDNAVMVSPNMPAGAPPAIGAGVVLIDPFAPTPDPTPASVTDLGDGMYLGPVGSVAADGSIIVAFPDGAELPDELFTTADEFALNISEVPDCELLATVPSAKVTYAMFELVTVPGVVLYSPSGLMFSALTDQPLDVETEPTDAEVAALEFITWVYADTATQVATPEAGCGASGEYTVDVDLVAGWNQLAWKFRLDSPGGSIDGYGLFNSSATEYHVSPLVL